MEDRFAMAGLPAKPFDVVRYERPKADKKGKVKIDGNPASSTRRRSPPRTELPAARSGA